MTLMCARGFVMIMVDTEFDTFDIFVLEISLSGLAGGAVGLQLLTQDR